MADEVGPLPDRRDYSSAIARIEQRLNDRVPIIADLQRKADENMAAHVRVEAKLAAIEAIIQNGLSSLVKEMHSVLNAQVRVLADHVAKEDVLEKNNREERERQALEFRGLHQMLAAASASRERLVISIGAFIITVALGIIGYLFHLNFGVSQ